MALPDPQGYADWREYARALVQALTTQDTIVGGGQQIVMPTAPPGYSYAWHNDVNGLLYDANFLTPPTAGDLFQIDTDVLADLAVSEPKIADLSVGTAKIKDAAILTAKIGDLQVVTAKIADLAVNTAKIANLAVDSAKIQNLAVNTAHIANLAVVNAKIGLLAVDTAQIAGLAVTNAKIGLLAVQTANIDSLAVTTAKIGLLAVDTAQIANLAVKTAQIDNLAITSAKIGTAEVTTLKIAGQAVTIPVSLSNPSSYVGNGAYQTIFTYSLTLDYDAGVFILFDAGHSYSSGVRVWDVKVLVDGVPLSNRGGSAGFTDVISIGASQIMLAGTYVITIDWKAADSTVTLLANSSLFIIATKR